MFCMFPQALGKPELSHYSCLEGSYSGNGVYQNDVRGLEV